MKVQVIKQVLNVNSLSGSCLRSLRNSFKRDSALFYPDLTFGSCNFDVKCLAGVVVFKVSRHFRVSLAPQATLKLSPRRLYGSAVGIFSSPNIRWILPQTFNVDSRHVFILLQNF